MSRWTDQSEKSSLRIASKWATVGVICIFFVVGVIRLHPSNFFGYTGDDGIYFSCAKAIAQGKGYVLASFPGTPAATKYPILYPLMLSLIWRLNFSFPSNISEAIGVTIAFGVLYVGLTFVFLRRRGFGDKSALFLTAACALNPLIVFYSGSVLTDIPFAALSLAAMILSEDALAPDGKLSYASLSGLLTGVSMMLRVFGLPVAAGLIVIAVLRRAWFQLGIFCISMAPFVGLTFYRSVIPRPPISPVSGALAHSTGWVHTWAYYTNYLNVWRQGVPTLAIFSAVLRNNAIMLARTPAMYFLSPFFAENTKSSWVLSCIGTAVILVGVCRQARMTRIQPVHTVLPFYVAVIMLWNYSSADRFLLPFFPLFAAGLLLEGNCLVHLIRRALTTPTPISDKISAMGLGFVVIVFVSVSAYGYSSSWNMLLRKSQERGLLLGEKREAYAWIVGNAEAKSRVLAYEDATLYLYTGRQAVRMITFTTADFYDHARMNADLDGIGDVANAINAEFWVSSSDDEDFEVPFAHSAYRARSVRFETQLPLVFESNAGHVRIYLLPVPCRTVDRACPSS